LSATSSRSASPNHYSESESDVVLGDIQEIIPKKKPTKTAKTSSKRKIDRSINADLPPMDNMEDIFTDMANNILELGLGPILQERNGRPYRVGTMCSGTESPICALEALSSSLQQRGMPPISIDHVFSAENELFKQGFIEVNYHPKIMFRDVREFLPEDATKAITAYGAEEDIPGNLDFLVAGFVCKNISTMNNHKKSLDEDGETGETWRSVLAYTTRFRPRIVLLENVTGKKEYWDDYIKAKLEAIDYACAWNIYDTKNYYIPQTRQRMYMIAIDKRQHGKHANQAANIWKDTMGKLQRQCSSPFGAFLTADYPDQYDYRSSPSSSNSDWALCRLRYAEIRSEERLGIRRPITRWSENGTVRPPDFADRDWYNTQRARVYDCIDISSLQAAQKGYDAMYKMMVWNVSQNVDRYKGSNDASFGLVSCITPTGIDFVSNRHTVLTGSQLLLLQGMPTDKLIFTSQSQKERQDLAGNAMTTTVIGASLLSALLAGGPGNMESPSRQESPQPDPEPERTRLPVSVVKYKIAPPKQLLDLKQLLVDAQMSSILCNCEGTRKTSKAPIKVCAQCAHTACATCAGNPTHSYDSTIPPSNRIQTPGDFERKWRPHLPPRLVFEKFPDIQNLIHNITDSAQLQDMDMAAQQFCIGDFKRQDNLWKVCYHSEQARLDLLLADTVEWRLYVNCPRSEPGSSLLRQNLSKPLARGLINDSLLAPRWTVHIPEPQTYNITITASQQRTGSWRNRMGLPDHKNETIPIHLDVDSDCVEDPSLAGSYTLLPHCGTAMESLYIMQKVDQPSLYLFLDPDQIGSTENDAFVFSHDCRRLPYGETRLKFATLNASWRPYDAKSEHAQKVETKVSGVWTFKENKNIKLKLAMPVLDVSIPSASALTSIKGQHCAQTIWILNVTVREAINLQSFSQYSWALEGAKRHKALEEFASWQTFSSKFANDCNCSPAFPPILWEMNNAKEVTPREDRKAAAAFERALKTRRPIITACTSSSASTSNVHIDIDVASLVHRANSLLATPHRNFWRLIVDHFDPPPEPFPRFGLQNNSSDEPYAGPLKIQYTLGKAQQKSLAWMKTQEEGVPLKLAEVVEEIHPELGWRVEAKAESTVIVRGGVLADLPSFGKTVTTISLINSEFEEFEPEEIVSKNRGENEASLIDIAATLIVCPAHIAVQWESEFKDCLGSDMFEDYGVLLIKRFSDLQRLNIDDFKKSRAIIVAKNVLAEKEYLNQLGQFAAMPAPASYRGRQFDVWMDYVSANMPQRVHEYENLDPAAFDEATQELFEERISSAQFNMMVPVAPKHGSAYLPWSKTQARNEKISQAKSKLPATRKRAATSVPLLQFFNWNRVVTDEYHYLLDGSLENHPACAAIKRLSASKRWILSGTPALTNFTDISQLGSFLGVTLGRDVYGDTFTTTEVEKRLIKEQTDVERFRSQTEVRSYHWYQARHSQAQSFVDSFVRQNEPELKDIPVSETLEAIQLGAGHHAVYLELSQRLISSGMQNNKSSGDWYNAILNDSTSADRSLIKSALEFKTEEGVKGLDGLITQRRNQRIDTETEFKNSAHKLKEECLAHLGDLEEGT
jgi:site-specific DNA-cytosine methylase